MYQYDYNHYRKSLVTRKISMYLYDKYKDNDDNIVNIQRNKSFENIIGNL